ncbi:Heme oxygenase 2 [Dissophora ornata]|nr:Heme oxygenase 2 [Dissophora ornata]
MTLLATELKEGTKVLHAEAGRSKFMLYVDAKILLPSPSVLERVLEEHKDNPNLSLIYFPDELFRVKNLEEDIEFFNGPDWREMLAVITPAQKAYISAIERCSSSPTPELLIAHSYVRYLGDLSGGQVLVKRLQKFNDLPEDKGASFYRFDLIEDAGMFKEMYRKRLNQVEVSDELQQQIVEEAKETFLRNIALFQEFDCEFEGLEMPRRAQEKGSVFEERAEKRTTKSNDEGPFTSLIPSSLWNSLAGVMGYTRVEP